MTTLSSEATRAYEYSIILGGRVGVGKTTLFHRILYGSLPEEPRYPTGHHYYERGLERGVYCTCVNGDTVKVSLWDTGGLERYTSMTANYFRNCHAVILVYSLDEEDTLFILRDWLIETRSLNSDTVVPALWGNKCDSDNSCITNEMALAFSKDNDIPTDLMTHVSALTGEGVKESFETLVKTIHSRRSGRYYDRGMILEPLIDPQLQTQKNTSNCAC